MKPLLITALLSSSLFGKGPVFQEKGEVIAIETESSSSRKGSWKEKTDVADFSGTCHLEFTGNTTLNGPPKSPLKYYFQVNKPGKYQLTIRARKRLETKRKDISNDCYVSLKGNFDSGGGAPLNVLRRDQRKEVFQERARQYWQSETQNAEKNAFIDGNTLKIRES